MSIPAAPTNPPSPALGSSRHDSVDVLRGVALLGILVMNISAFALPSASYTNPLMPGAAPFAGPFEGANKIAWFLCHLLAEQKMMAIFSMLFGAGLALMGERRTDEHGRPVPFAALYYRRLAFLFAVGFVHAFAIWYGDILMSYALCGLVLYPLRRLRPVWLLTIGLAVFLVAVVIGIGFGAVMGVFERAAAEAQAARDAGQTLTNEQEQVLKGWTDAQANMNPDVATITQTVDGVRSGVLGSLRYNLENAVFLQIFLFPIWTLWRGLGLMLIGMGLMKLGMFSATWSTRSYAIIALLGYSIGMPVIVLGAGWLIDRNFAISAVFGFEGQINYIFSLPVALAHASVVMLACRFGIARPLQHALAAAGRMALTNYLLTSVLMMACFSGWGLGLFARFERAEMYWFVLGVWIVLLVWSPLWLARFKFGPMEWLWRSWTYARWQPLRVSNAARGE